VQIDLTKKLNFFTTATYTRGRLERFDGSEIPQDHIPPFFGKTSLNFNEKKFGLEFFSLYNGWKKIKNYNPDGEDNQQYATPEGMPSWMTFNFRSSFQLCPSLQLQLAVENIMDRNYRYFASGFSAPGRNFIIALRANW
jgi:hemoglobin/transferrin/lactoferrin receptor protein